MYVYIEKLKGCSHSLAETQDVQSPGSIPSAVTKREREKGGGGGKRRDEEREGKGRPGEGSFGLRDWRSV